MNIYHEPIKVWSYKVQSENRPGLEDTRVSMDIGIHTFLMYANFEIVRYYQYMLKGILNQRGLERLYMLLNNALNIVSKLSPDKDNLCIDKEYLALIKNDRVKEEKLYFDDIDRGTLYNPEYWQTFIEGLKGYIPLE